MTPAVEVRVITIARKYGSGGGPIAEILARRLGWRLLDRSIIARISESVKASPADVRSHEETVDPWFHRIMRVIWRGGFEGALSRPESEPVDADAIAALWKHIILEAAAAGGCVIVGRGGQCLLKKRPGTFHVFVYAPLAERAERLREREPAGTDRRAVALERDRHRSAYIRHYFGEDWRDPSLYDLMLCSSIGLERAADVILFAAGLTRSA